MSHASCLTIVMIDDCAEDRETYCRFLRQDSLYTYRILEFKTGTQAMTWCQQQTPDVILLDFMLSDGDGLGVVQQFRSTHSHSQTAVIMLTGQGDEATAVKAMKSGVQDYLVKDKLTPAILQSAIHHALEKMYLTRQLEQSREQQQLIDAIALRIRQSLKLEDILSETAKQVRQFLQADRVVVYQFQPDMNDSIVAESVLEGWTVVLGKQIQDTCFQQGSGKDNHQGKSRAVDDIYQADLTHCNLQLLEQFEVKAYLVVPILVNEQLWGLLIAHQCSASRHWQTAELDLLERLAVQIAIAIQQASAYQQLQTELAQRQLTEAALQASQEKLKLTLNFTGIADWEWNPITNEIIASQNGIKWFFPGKNYTNLTYEKWLNQIHPEDRQWVEQELLQAIAVQTDYAAEYRVILPDNSIRWILAKGRGIYDATGQLLRMLGVVMEITERKLAEAERQRAQILQMELQLLEDILENAQVGYWEWNLVDNQGYFSTTLKRMLGYETDELTNSSDNWHCLIFPEDLSGFLESFALYFQNCRQTSYFNELRYRHKNGSPVWAICSGRVIEWDNEGKPLRIIGCNIDITQRKQVEAQLLAVTSLQQAILDGSDYAIIYNNLNGIQMFNAAAQRMLGYTADEVISKASPSFFHDPEELAQRAAELSQELGREIAPGREFFTLVTQNGDTYENEWTYIRKDGSRLPVFLSVKVLHDLDGQNIGFLGIAKDISQQKQIELALKESEHRYETLAQAAPVAIFRLDHSGNCNYVNDRWADLTGRPKQAALGKGWADTIHPEDRDRILREWFAADLGPTELFYNEGRHLLPDGSITWFHCYILPETNCNGVIIGYIGTLTDITIRKQAEQKLEESRTMLQLVMDTFPQRVFWKDRQSRFLGCNQTFLRDSQITIDQVLGKTDFELPWAKWAHLYCADDAMVMNTRTPKLNYEEPLQGPNGEELWLRTNKIPLTNSAGEVIGVLVSHEDITQRKQAEVQMHKTNEQLAHANIELARATRLKDEFLANMSHELRTPLNAILGMSEGFLEGVFGTINERQVKAIATIERSGRHLLELINDILDLSKIESGKLELQLSDVSVSSLCDGSLTFIKQMALKKNIHLTTHIANNIDSIKVDERRLRQVLINLLSNAVKFTPEGGSVKLEVCLEAAEVPGCQGVGEVNSASSLPSLCFHITDTGIGIASEEISKLFQPFIQLDSSLNRQYNGTGLGLALVQRIVTLHGGTVSVNSEVGKGSCFSIRIPYCTADYLPAKQVKTALPSYCLKADNAPVLIIEDSVPAADQISRYLCEMGMQPLVYPQGEGAVEEVLRLQPALIILDLQLPNLSGWDLLEQFKTNPQIQDIPVIIISVVDEGTKGLAQGAFEYLVKPITRAQLQSAIDRMQYSAHSELPNLTVLPKAPLETPVILLVEDNQANIDTMSGYLESRGYHLIMANDGQKAIDKTKAQNPDLIVMDIQMPGIDGLEAIRRIRSEPQFLHLPIIALTALAMPGDRETCLAAGANEYLTKPVKLKQLVTTIQQLLKR